MKSTVLAAGPLRVRALARRSREPTSSGWQPQRTRGLSIPIPRVALALDRGQRVDPVEGLAGGLDVLVGEVLPDEPPDRPHAGPP